jgi:hypothetical protein
VNQTIGNTGPASAVGGTILYTLSTPYWSSEVSVPAINGTYNIFTINAGDPTQNLTVSKLLNNTLTLGASANILTQITSASFASWNIVPNIIVPNNTTIFTNITSVNPQIFISQYNALTGQSLYVEFETPFISSQRNIVAYATNFGENATEATRICPVGGKLNYQYSKAGTYFISYSAIFTDNSILSFTNNIPITIANQWNTYDPNNLRQFENATLTLPYSENEVLIQPNEFGDSDIFNTCITRIQACIDYLNNNLITLNNNTPTVYFGWLGCSSEELSQGIKWHTQSFYSESYPYPELAVSSGGNSPFVNIQDVKETNNYIFVLDGTLVRIFSAGCTPSELYLNGIQTLNQILIKPSSIEVDETETMLFVCDTPNNIIYRFDLDLQNNFPSIDLGLTVGGLGNRLDKTKFNSPSQIVYANQKLYVLDYNNKCVKEFNTDLGPTFTYYIDEFYNDQPVNIAVHPIFNYLYVLGASNTVYVFDEQNNNLVSSFSLNQTIIISGISNMLFDESGDFIYVVTGSETYKFTSDGYFVNILTIPTDVIYSGGKKSLNRSLLFFGSNFIVKVQDILNLYSIGSGLPTEYWSYNQLMVSRDEFSADLNYNRSLVRLAQNLKTFRNSLNATLAFVTEQTPIAVIKYIGSYPLAQSDLPVFDDNIELENIGIGVNELHLPQVLNRELVKFYDGLTALTSLLNINDLNITSNKSNCNLPFCWSWNALSTSNLTLPALKICGVNPITYAELASSYPTNYAPSKIWGNATSTCCSNVVPPV